MGRLGKVMVALTAFLAIVFSLAFGMVIWHVWRYPIKLNVENDPNGMRWESARFVWEVQLEDGNLDQIRIQRKDAA